MDIITKFSMGTKIEIDDKLYLVNGLGVMKTSFGCYDSIEMELVEAEYGEEKITLKLKKSKLALTKKDLLPLAVFLTNE